MKQSKTLLKTSCTSRCPNCYSDKVFCENPNGGKVECSNCGATGTNISRVWNEVGVDWDIYLDASTGQVKSK